MNDEMAKLLAPLTDSRRAHSIAVGRRMESVAELLPEHLRADAVTAAYLHDVGYAVPGLGFHPIDGARLLRSLGYSPVVCHLVAFHTASVVEADVRDIDPEVFEEFEVENVAGLALANDFMWWADLSTGPSGQTFTVDERIDEILSRYETGSIVHTAISRSAPLLRAAAQRAAGSM
ncbi:HD domain-containing protein [Nocardia sp. NPDC127606]|uniref:HD domain-containing protein n=1 Tax=Nocardia sp. NPDC127606 TaxID=3345406 RepID=UPI00363B42C0